LLFGGEHLQDIYETLDHTRQRVNNEEETVYQQARRVFTAHFSPKKNREYYVYTFRLAKQASDENINQFYTRLINLSAHCEFHDKDREIKSQIIMNCTSDRLRQEGLVHSTEWDLKKLLEMGAAWEMTEIQAANIKDRVTSATGGEETLNRIKYEYNRRQPSSSYHQARGRSSRREPSPRAECNRCGNDLHQDGPDQCPAKGKTCHQWGNLNHFARCCFQRPEHRPSRERTHKPKHDSCDLIKRITEVINQQRYEESSDDEEDGDLFILKENNSGDESSPTTIINLLGCKIPFTADSGSKKTVIDLSTYQQFGRPRLRPTGLQLFPYGSSTPIRLLGEFQAIIEVNTSRHWALETIFVFEQSNSGCLLSNDTSQQLKLFELSPGINIPQSSCLPAEPQQQTVVPSIELVEGPEVTEPHHNSPVIRRSTASFHDNNVRADQVPSIHQQAKHHPGGLPSNTNQQPQSTIPLLHTPSTPPISKRGKRGGTGVKATLKLSISLQRLHRQTTHSRDVSETSV